MSESSTPGLLLTLAIAIAAYFSQLIPLPPFTMASGSHPVDAMIVAIVLGLVVRNSLPLSSKFRPGIQFAVVRLLPIGIVLMGAKLDFFDVVRASGSALLINVACVSVALGLTLLLCRWAGVGRKLGLLIGIGTAICGGTAIAVTAPIIEADETDTAFAVSAITVFGLISIFVFPLAGGAMNMNETDFGIWVGTSVHATPQVMAAGFAYSQSAGDVAVIVKLVRVLLLAPMVVVLGLLHAREKRKREQPHVAQRTKLQTLFPPFVAGFLLMAVLNSARILPDVTFHLKDSALWSAQDTHLSIAQLATLLSNFLTTVAMAGVGLGVHVRTLAKVGPKAFYVGLFATVVIAGFSLALIQLL